MKTRRSRRATPPSLLVALVEAEAELQEAVSLPCVVTVVFEALPDVACSDDTVY